jgi:3-methylcrotonyl-CoA carboxylase beta subunit
LLDIKLKQAQKSGKEFSQEDNKKLLDEIIQSYENASTPLYAAARLWIDEIIDPAKTREYISMAIDVANNNPEFPRFNPGVIQT